MRFIQMARRSIPILAVTAHTRLHSTPRSDALAENAKPAPLFSSTTSSSAPPSFVQPQITPSLVLEFAARSSLLFSTVASIVFLYKYTPDCESEQLVAERSKALSDAQAEYTGDGSADVIPGQLSKSDQRQLVLRLSDSLAEAELSNYDNPSTKHRVAARSLRSLASSNGGCYVKIAQHLASLDYLLPREYTDTLKSLYNDTPTTPLAEAREVVRSALGEYPEDIFDTFDPVPIASASLAQVHVATKGGKRLAVKVQHPAVGRTAFGDIFILTKIVRFLERYVDGFTFGWLVDEIAPQLYLELDFENEAKNGAKAKLLLSREFSADAVCVPAVHSDLSSRRVLTMDFEPAFPSTDLASLDSVGLDRGEVARLVSTVFCHQVFQSGFVHCDPHPANLMVRRSEKTGGPQMVLVDHGLYKSLGDEFRLDYCDLWLAIALADVDEIKRVCQKMKAGKMFPLLTAMLTARPFDEVLDRAKMQSEKRKRGGGSSPANVEDQSGQRAGDNTMIRQYATRFMKEIAILLDSVPRELCLLLKMNDCLRHIDSVLGRPVNTLEVSALRASSGKLEHELDRRGLGRLRALALRTRARWGYFLRLIRIKVLFWALRRAGNKA